MTRLLGALVLVAACGGNVRTAPVSAAAGPPAMGPVHRASALDTPSEPGVGCDAGDLTFVRRALIHAWNNAPESSVVARAHVDAVAAMGRAAWLDAVLASPRFGDAWEDVVRDWLYVARAGYRDNSACTEGPLLPTVSSDLARHVRDAGPLEEPFASAWNFTDLVQSALALDDMSVIFRVAPFVQLSGFVPDGDDPNDEIAWRKVHADIFERRFLNRRTECLACHNSEYSVTGNADPLLDRTWEVPAKLEEAVYGSSFGRSILDLAAVFRVSGVLAVSYNPGTQDLFSLGEGVAPWGMSPVCGGFIAPDAIADDILGYTGFLAHDLGPRSSLWDLEQLYRAGAQQTRGRGLETDADGRLSGESGLVWLTALSLSEFVWTQISGQRLTTPNSFPRNQAQRDVLLSLATAFVEGGFSLRALVKAALLSPYVSLGETASCAGSDYPLPAVFDPWVTADTDAERRQNSLGDGVTRLPPRTLLRSLAHALHWPSPARVFTAGVPGEEVPYPEEAELQGDLGLFLFFGEAGFRGHNFQETLAFESAFGTCRQPYGTSDGPDLIDTLVATGGPGDTLGQGLEVVSDALLGYGVADLGDGVELRQDALQDLLAQLVGPLDAPLADSEEGLRRYCAALLASPQLQLDGLPATAASQPRPSLGNDGQTECLGVLESLGTPASLRCAGVRIQAL